MSLLLAEQQQLLIDSIERYFADNYDFDARQVIAASDAGYSAEHWTNLAEFGWLGLPFEEAMGGFGGSISDVLPLARTMGKHLALEPYLSSVVLAGRTLAAGTNSVLQEQLLPEIIAGERLACLALEEAGARGNPRYVAVSATEEGNGYRIKGEKIAVMNAAQSRYLLVSARTEGAVTDTQGIDLFMLDSQNTELNMTAYTSVDGHRAANISFDTLVRADSMLTAPGQAYPLLQQAVDDAILVTAAEALGAMQALMDASAMYISTRQQFRAPLASFQVLRHKMADMTIAIKGAECLFEALVAELGREGGLPTAKLSVLKAKMGATGRLIGSAAVQLHGGIGTTDELNVGHYLKRLVTLNVHFGNVDHHLKKVWQAVA